MAQVTSGVRKVFSSPIIYNIFQTLVGAPYVRKRFIEDYVKINNGSRLLDIGCGTGELIRYISEMTYYVGFDLSARYIESAKRNFDHRQAEFIAKPLTRKRVMVYEQFDRVTAMGLLHHIGDGEVLDLFQLAKQALKENGFFVSIDPCYVEKQSTISRMIINGDRGKNVRTLTGYQRLAESVFSYVEIHHRNNLLRIPYDHAVLICS